MKPKLIYTQPKTNLTLFCYEYSEAHSKSDGSDDYYSVPVREWIVKTPDETWLRVWRSDRAWDRGQDKRRIKQIERINMIEWMAAYVIHAQFPRPLQCHNIDGNFTVCPMVRLDLQNVARCSIRSDEHGYSSGGSPDTMRELPKDRHCDLSAYAAKHQQEKVQGPLRFVDLWKIDRGIAAQEIAPKSKEVTP